MPFSILGLLSFQETDIGQKALYGKGHALIYK